MRVKILGKVWTLRFVPNLANRGDCDPPTTKGKSIRVSAQLHGEERLRTILHEMLHSADWHKDEEWVEEVSTDMARVLWRLNYREGI